MKLLCFRSTIRDKIIPHAVSWFTGEAAQDEYGDIEDEEDDLDEEDDEDDEDEEEDEDDDDDDEDEDESKTRKKVIQLFLPMCSYYSFLTIHQCMLN